MSARMRAGIVVGVLVVFGGLAYVASNPKQDTPTPAQQSSFTKKEVSEHDSSDDCWTIIEGIVYDVTDFITSHPGGSNILSACGEDATEFFNGEKAGQAGGTNDHSSSARNRLEAYELGPLVQE